MVTRRSLLEKVGTGVLLAGASHAISQSFGTARAKAGALNLPVQLPEGTRGEAALDALPGKKPLIKLSYLPPNYETPIKHLRSS
jgi:hypothetical protein